MTWYLLTGYFLLPSLLSTIYFSTCYVYLLQAYQGDPHELHKGFPGCNASFLEEDSVHSECSSCSNWIQKGNFSNCHVIVLVILVYMVILIKIRYQKCEITCDFFPPFKFKYRLTFFQ